MNAKDVLEKLKSFCERNGGKVHVFDWYNENYEKFETVMHCILPEPRSLVFVNDNGLVKLQLHKKGGRLIVDEEVIDARNIEFFFTANEPRSFQTDLAYGSTESVVVVEFNKLEFGYLEDGRKMSMAAVLERWRR